MNINLIYEGNQFQFDIPQEVTLDYIKGLSSKIFGKDPLMNLYYHSQNLSKLSDNILLKDIIEEDDDNIIINVQKKQIQHKRFNFFPKITQNSFNNSVNLNDNENTFQLLKNKFTRFQNHFENTMKEIDLFNGNLEDNFSSLKTIINEYKKNIKKFDQKLATFYDNSPYQSLKELFEKNIDSKLIEENELNDIATQIEKCVFNYKFLQTEYNYQKNIISYIHLKIEELLQFKININKLEEKEDFDEIVNQLEFIFNELNNKNYQVFTPISLISSLFNIKNESLNVDLKTLNNSIENKRNSESISKTLVKNDDTFNDKKAFHLKSKSINKPFKNFKMPNVQNYQSLNLKNLDLFPSNDTTNRHVNDNEKIISNYKSIKTISNRSFSPTLDLTNMKNNHFIKPKIIEKETQILKKKSNNNNEENKMNDENQKNFFQRKTTRKSTMANIILEKKNKEIELEVQLFKKEKLNNSDSDSSLIKIKEKEKVKFKTNKDKEKEKDNHKEEDKNKENKEKDKNKENNEKNNNQTTTMDQINLNQQKEKNQKKNTKVNINDYLKDLTSEKIDELKSKKLEKNKKKDENKLSLNKDKNQSQEKEKTIEKEEEDLNKLKNTKKNVIKITKNKISNNSKNGENENLKKKEQGNNIIKNNRNQKSKEKLEKDKEEEKEKEKNKSKIIEKEIEEKKEDKKKSDFSKKTSPKKTDDYELIHEGKKSLNSKEFSKDNLEKLKDELINSKKDTNNLPNIININYKTNKVNNINDNNKDLISVIYSIGNETNNNEKSIGKDSNSNENIIINNDAILNENLVKKKKSRKKSMNKFDFII